MTEYEQYLIDKFLKTHEVKVVGDVRPIEKIHITYERQGGK